MSPLPNWSRYSTSMTILPIKKKSSNRRGWLLERHHPEYLQKLGRIDNMTARFFSSFRQFVSTTSFPGPHQTFPRLYLFQYVCAGGALSNHLLQNSADCKFVSPQVLQVFACSVAQVTALPCALLQSKIINVVLAIFSPGAKASVVQRKYSEKN